MYVINSCFTAQVTLRKGQHLCLGPCNRKTVSYQSVGTVLCMMDYKCKEKVAEG